MDDKLDDFILENDFDVFEPHSGHEDRFLKKLNQQNNGKKSIPWKWLSVAASILLFIGFQLGSLTNKPTTMPEISPEMNETHTFFVSTINQELREIEKYRNIDTESIIEDALDKIEELEDQYTDFKKELNFMGNEQQVIQGMIANYQQRLQILEDLLLQLEELKKHKNQKTPLDDII